MSEGVGERELNDFGTVHTGVFDDCFERRIRDHEWAAANLAVAGTGERRCAKLQDFPRTIAQ